MGIFLAVDESSRRQSIFRCWRNYKREVQITGSGPAFERLLFPEVPGASFSGRLVVVPPGRQAESVTGLADKVFLVVDGETDFCSGGAWHGLTKLDMISIPAGNSFHYLNGGFENAILCEVSAHDEPVERPHDLGVEHWRWQEYRRDFHWTLPLAESPGFCRGSGPLVKPPQLRGHTVRLPANQTSPWHYAARDLLFLVVDGEIEFECGGQRYEMEKLDFLLIPALMPYKYTNFGLVEELHLSIGGKLEPGKKGVYFHEDPGWPVRADAKTMPVEIDIYGDAKIS